MQVNLINKDICMFTGTRKFIIKIMMILPSLNYNDYYYQIQFQQKFKKKK